MSLHTLTGRVLAFSIYPWPRGDESTNCTGGIVVLSYKPAELENVFICLANADASGMCILLFYSF